MNILILCEKHGRVRDAFQDQGHHAISVDLEPTTSPRGSRNRDGFGTHHQGDALDIADMFINEDGIHFDLMIAFPPCTYLTSSGLHWNHRKPGRAEKTEAALQFVAGLWRLPIKRKCLENPRGCINTRLPFMPRPQWIQPHQFGHDASKATGLWLDNLPPLALDPLQYVPGRTVEWPPGSGRMVERWGNQTDSGQNRLGPSDDRADIRGETYPGIANAMAEQWSRYIEEQGR